MRLVTLKLPETLVTMIDELVKCGWYESRSEFIRIAVTEKLKREVTLLDRCTQNPRRVRAG